MHAEEQPEAGAAGAAAGCLAAAPGRVSCRPCLGLCLDNGVGAAAVVVQMAERARVEHGEGEMRGGCGRLLHLSMQPLVMMVWCLLAVIWAACAWEHTAVGGAQKRTSLSVGAQVLAANLALPVPDESAAAAAAAAAVLPVIWCLLGVAALPLGAAAAACWLDLGFGMGGRSTLPRVRCRTPTSPNTSGVLEGRESRHK
eukprot:1143533-Pelagomonas_calceolata.AAC.6